MPLISEFVKEEMSNPLTKYGLFGWNYRYLLLHPWKLGEEIYYHVKWFWQRGRRGYADCDVWGLDSYLVTWLPGALESLRTQAHGHPVGMTPKTWDIRLERMRDGFLTAREIGDMNFRTVEEAKVLQKRMYKGLRMFSRYFLDLWD